MRKLINKKEDTIQVYWNNNTWKVNIYNNISNANQTWGGHSVKCTNVSHRT